MLLPCLIKISYNRELKRRSWLRRTSTGSGSFFIHEQSRNAPPPPPHSPGNNVINDTAYCAVAMTQKPSPPTSPTVIGPSTHNQKNTSGFKPPLACIEIAWVAQKVEGEGEGEKHPLPFSPFPIPYPFRRLFFWPGFKPKHPHPPPPHPPFYKPSWNSLRICLSPGITSGSLL